MRDDARAAEVSHDEVGKLEQQDCGPVYPVYPSKLPGLVWPMKFPGPMCPVGSGSPGT